jgi:4-hydroxy-tetrahydrodipicolinate synthase
MSKPNFISAIGSPLDPDENLHEAGLEAHLADQWAHGIGGVLVAGTMGMMQLLKWDTYRNLARRAVEISRGNGRGGEVMVGAGDCSFARTRQRIEFLNTLDIDGVVVLTPFFIGFSQQELIAYYRALADASKAPLFLYDLPQRTNCKIEFETVLKLAKHPNIRGIKCSDEALSYARRLIDTLGDPFRVIVAQPMLVDVTLKAGIHEQLDGVYALAPALATNIGEFAARGDWPGAAAAQRKLTALLRFFHEYNFSVFTTLLNARGIPGNYAPRPYAPLTPPEKKRVLASPEIRELLRWPGGGGAPLGQDAARKKEGKRP